MERKTGRKRKHQASLGWWQRFKTKDDAGNVPLNNEIFNQGFSRDGDIATADGACGAISEELKESELTPLEALHLLNKGE